MAKHAYLAASASERWLNCPPSAKLCAAEEDRGSPYAQQGTDAHELAAYLAETALGRNVRDPTPDLEWYDADELIGLIRSGEIQDSKTIIGILFARQAGEI